MLKPRGYVAFEVGEVRSGKLKMEELVIPVAREASLEAELVLINSQVFTKTANCWGVTNQVAGTNTNRDLAPEIKLRIRRFNSVKKL